ncbi:MAG: Mpo1-like protein [Alphaproteobacteria bacterium]
MAKEIERYADFWPYYLGEHRKPLTRALHYFGTGLGIGWLIAAIATQIWWLIALAFVSGYLFAWIGHFFVEKNRPATFTYPLWSLVSDFRLCGTWLAGRMGAELTRHQIR